MKDDKLLKLLRMTESDNDNEALVAIRTANKYVKSWENFFKTHPSDLKSVVELKNIINQWKVAYDTVILRNKNLNHQLLQQQSEAHKVYNENQRLVSRNRKLESKLLNIKSKNTFRKIVIIGLLFFIIFKYLK